MIQEAYVNFKTAKLLKEKEFDEDCSYYYDTNGRLRSKCEMCWNEADAPTQQMAMRWLREQKDINIVMKYSRNTYMWGYNVFRHKGPILTLKERVFKKYEEAIDAALEYVLENLI